MLKYSKDEKLTMFPDKYHPIAHTLRERIYNGGYRPGQRLPSTRHLCQEFKVSLNTVHRAIKVLKGEGLIYSLDRSGVYVSIDKPEYTLRERIKSGVYKNMLPPRDELTLELGVSESILTLVLNRLEEDGLILRRKEGIYLGREGEVGYWSEILRQNFPEGLTRTRLAKENSALYKLFSRRAILDILIPEADQKAVEFGKRNRGRKRHAMVN